MFIRWLVKVFELNKKVNIVLIIPREDFMEAELTLWVCACISSFRREQMKAWGWGKKIGWVCVRNTKVLYWREISVSIYAGKSRWRLSWSGNLGCFLVMLVFCWRDLSDPESGKSAGNTNTIFQSSECFFPRSRGFSSAFNFYLILVIRGLYLNRQSFLLNDIERHTKVFWARIFF